MGQEPETIHKNGHKELVHVFMVSFPGQGHINPLLRLGKRIASKGLLVTFTTTENFGQAIRNSNDAVSDRPVPVGDGFIRFEFFDDEWPDGDPRKHDMDQYLPQLDIVGRRWVPERIAALAREGRPVACLVNNPFLPWVSDVADELGLCSAMLWPQSCACFLAYYCFHHKLVPFPTENALELDVEIPTLPLLKWDQIPTFLHPTTPYAFLKRAILSQYNNLSKPFCVLMDTFYELENATVNYTVDILAPLPIKPVGPLFKKSVPGGAIVRADPLRPDQDCLKWLDSKPDGSVVYISFGTIVFLKQEQVDEIAAGIEAAGVSFLWVMKPPLKESGLSPHTLPDGFMEKAGDNGKVVHFAPQEQVLAHPAIACFMTHCGWNSSMESLTSGVPVIAFPSWGDQCTDAKFLCDVYETGVQLTRGEHEKRTIPRDEVEKCIREATLGPKAAEMKKNALKWKTLAEEAVADGGSSDQNIDFFVDGVRKRSEIILANAKINGGQNGVALKVNGH
ncbi:gallate 1-beta-glucosyltransferase 84A23-like [Amaranthus tricolor]|uniref:gallate 1-beta-glucosyltransferase 84A23-like n=1 Tax=Amaranthus tricolor TaxID=29722 RepID=UPI00258ABCA4|nr:gallate 1-beta-glucosyltransferase 84A23-like [Amaranthus tricolor]